MSILAGYRVTEMKFPSRKYLYMIIILIPSLLLANGMYTSGFLRKPYIMKNQWAEVNDGTAPSPRAQYVSAYYNGKMYIYGGQNGTTTYNDLWEFDLTTYAWTQRASNSAGTSRMGSVGGVYNRKLYIFGGYNYSENYRNEVLNVI